MDIGGALSIGIGDDLIGQADDGTIVFVKPTPGIFRCHFLGFADEFAENVRNIFIQLSIAAGISLSLSCGGSEELSDITTEADRKANVETGKCPLDVRHAIEVAGVVRQNFDGGPVPFEGHPMVFLEVVDIQVFEELDIDNRSIAVLDVGALMEMGERFSNLRFRHLVFFDQDALEIRQAFPGLGNCIIQFVLGDAVVRDQEIELGRVLFSRSSGIEEGDSEGLGYLRDGLFIFSGKSCAALFVEELKHAYQIILSATIG